MYKFGLKLWSTNDSYVKDAMDLFEDGIYDYFELYVVPGSYDSYIWIWEKLKIPYVIHGPHWAHGVNLADKRKNENNIRSIAEAQRYAEKLKSQKIILHPGFAGDIKETIAQIKSINDKRILIENKPYFSIIEGLICNGFSPEDISYILNETHAGFCLDIGHAIYSANAQQIDAIYYLKRFLALGPEIFHLSDGDKKGVYDEHKHFGKGNFDIENILSLLPDNAAITVETDKDSEDNLADFKKDVIRLRFEIENICKRSSFL